MTTLTLQAKKAYCAKTRRSNYAASLRLEGFNSSRSDAQQPLPTRDAVLNQYACKQPWCWINMAQGKTPTAIPAHVH